MKEQTLIETKPASAGLRFKLLGTLILLISTGFVWMATDQVIAPPVVRIMDLLWKLLVCRCLFQFDLLS